MHRLSSSSPRRGLRGIPLGTSFNREKCPFSPAPVLYLVTSQQRTCPLLSGICGSLAAFAEGPCQGQADGLPGTLCIRRAAASGTSPSSRLAARLNLTDSTAHSWPLPRHSWICHLKVALPGVPHAKTGQPGEPTHVTASFGLGCQNSYLPGLATPGSLTQTFLQQRAAIAVTPAQTLHAVAAF